MSGGNGQLTLAIVAGVFAAGVGIFWTNWSGEHQDCAGGTVFAEVLGGVRGLTKLDSPLRSAEDEASADYGAFIAYALATHNSSKMTADILNLWKLHQCCDIYMLFHPQLPLDDDTEEEQVGWKTLPGLSHIFITCSESRSAAVIVIAKWRQQAQYWWLPGWSRTNATADRAIVHLLEQKLSLLQQDSVGIARNLQSGQDMTIAGFTRNQPAATMEFIPCNETNRIAFSSQFPSEVASGDHGDLIRHKVKKMLFAAKLALDKLGVPFWLSSGTFLGYFRQCDVIPYTDDVDVGVFIEDYQEGITSAMEEAGFVLEHRFGLLSDSFQLAFKHTWFKLDIFFFYKETDHYWNGGTFASTGEKYKYPFRPFQLCWTEFLGLLVRIPCHNTEWYIEDNYGKDWMTPLKEWDWKASASNVENNGQWNLDEEDAIEFFNHG